MNHYNVQAIPEDPFICRTAWNQQRLVVAEQVVPLKVSDGLHNGFQVLPRGAGMVW